MLPKLSVLYTMNTFQDPLVVSFMYFKPGVDLKENLVKYLIISEKARLPCVWPSSATIIDTSSQPMVFWVNKDVCTAIQG
jgi:hypothetical protein